MGDGSPILIEHSYPSEAKKHIMLNISNLVEDQPFLFSPDQQDLTLKDSESVDSIIEDKNGPKSK